MPTRPPPEHDPMVDEVDRSLLAEYREMTVIERLRAATRHAATLERLRRAASSDR